MDYYKILGVSNTASQDEIKKAYRKLAMQYHPDRGGDHNKFAEINSAYDTLSDPNKRKEYDNPQTQFDNSRQQYYNSSNVNDIFSQFFGSGFNRVQRRNADIGISIKIDLEDVLTGKDIIGKYRLNSGNDEVATIRVPPGVESGVTMRYKGLGDNSLPQLPRGDLLVKIIVNNHKRFVRDRLHLRQDCVINVFDLILGTEMMVDKLGGGTIIVKIPAGTHPGTVLSCAGYGLPDPNTGRTGNMYLEIKGKTPKIQDFKILEKVKTVYDEISSST